MGTHPIFESDFDCLTESRIETMSQSVLVTKSEMAEFVRRLMAKVGCRLEDADQLAQVLVDADYRGHFSHGLNRLEMYFNDIRTGVTGSGGHVSLTDDARQ